MLRLDFKAALAVDEEGVIEGLASVFATADRGGDVVHKGAFASVTFPLPMLASHDPADVIGVWEEGRETAEGLKVKGRLALTVQRAREVRDLILAKALTGLSIGYVATRKAARKGGGRDLLAVDLCEISVVAVPMHPGARITSAKSADHKGGVMDPEELQEALEGVETKAVGAVAAAVTEAIKPLADRLDTLEAKGNRPATEGKGETELTPERKAFQAYLRFGNQLPEAEAKALLPNSDPQGGYLAPPELSAEILKDLVEFSPIRSVASVRGTSAPSVIYPTRSPMGNAQWDDALDDETETSGNPFGSLEVFVKGMSTYVDVHNQLLQDAPVVETEVRGAVAEDFGKKESIAFVKGDGVTQPEGVMTNASVTVYNNGHATVLQPDSLIKFLYAHPATYRNQGVWAMNGATLAAVRLLKDGQNNYLWQPSYQAGQPETLLGRPILEVLDMDDVASGKDPILYGDFSGYRILDRLSLSILVDPYTRATQKQTRYHAGRRVGGRVIMPAKFRKLRMAV
jgi:HK97 family phage major capsid protein/HK97 family phage prohead protease